MGEIKIINPGILTTIQDKGRWGYQAYGMPVAGYMDDFSARIANLLVGNSQDEALIEATLVGPEIEFQSSSLISICGADMGGEINGRSVPMWTSILVGKDDRLKFTGLKSGLRTYIAFRGAIQVPVIMGSKSTFTRGKIGGFQGRKLQAQDLIPIENLDSVKEGSYLPQEFIPSYQGEDNLIRLVMGPQDDYFSQEAKETFLKSKYEITSEADRMGYRLEGAKIQHDKGADIISDGISFGSVQVPGHGHPIIMMADRQTTGGYTKIATVISPDLPKLAQLGPGSSLRFKALTVDEAHEEYRTYESQILRIKDFIEENKFSLKRVRELDLNLLGQSYQIGVREIRE